MTEASNWGNETSQVGTAESSRDKTYHSTPVRKIWYFLLHLFPLQLLSVHTAVRNICCASLMCGCVTEV